MSGLYREYKSHSEQIDWSVLALKIRDHFSIVNLIGQYIQLHKKGHSYKGKCPFHKEKTASFDVQPDKGLYYCFGCGARGDVISFIEQINKQSFCEAIRFLAELGNIPIYDERCSPFQAFDDFERAIRKQIQTRLEDNRSIQSIIEPIGVREIVLPDEFLPLGDLRLTWINQYARGRGFHWKQLIGLGVGGCSHGYYAGCLILPVFFEGKLVFWQARDTLNRFDVEKYQTPPGSSPQFVLFNIEQAVQFAQHKEGIQQGEIILVEGYFGSLRTGTDSSATFGSFIHDGQIALLKRLGVKKILYALDPDTWKIKEDAWTDRNPKNCKAIDTLNKLQSEFEQVRYLQLAQQPDNTGTLPMRELIQDAPIYKK